MNSFFPYQELSEKFGGGVGGKRGGGGGGGRGEKFMSHDFCSLFVFYAGELEFFFPHQGYHFWNFCPLYLQGSAACPKKSFK